MSTPRFLPPEGVPTESKWAQLPSAHMVLQMPEDSSGHEGGVNLSGRFFVNDRATYWAFKKVLSL